MIELLAYAPRGERKAIASQAVVVLSEPPGGAAASATSRSAKL